MIVPGEERDTDRAADRAEKSTDRREQLRHALEDGKGIRRGVRGNACRIVHEQIDVAHDRSADIAKHRHGHQKEYDRLHLVHELR